MRSSKITFLSQKHKLVGLFEEPRKTQKPLILLLHGLTNSMQDCPLIKESAHALQELGFPTFRFDYYGSGQSDGEFKDKTWHTMVQNTKDALRYIKTELNYPRIGLWGRSLGAILGATICDDSSIFASVFISMTVHTNTSFAASFPKEQSLSLPIIGTAVVKGKPILHRRFYEETTWIDKLQEKHLSKAKNILIMQGTEDKTVYNPMWATEIYNLVNKPKKLMYIKGANHAYKGYESETINQGVRWFLKYSNNHTYLS